ncbi:hypothetical protein [Nostoc edaphicum]|uniref:hypothetical protein n=1 Tax=Nostoc edaphicum TaxID=264686 RepID=UPI001EE9D358|nr:hypothetical protein [Nostoc edaphicum]
MALYKLEDFAGNYSNPDFDNYEVRDFDVYSNIDDDKVGTVKHILVEAYWIQQALATYSPSPMVGRSPSHSNY